jgi:hypothetical protein
MIIHCPKCSYSRKPTDTAPSGICPECGVIFEKFLAHRNQKPAQKIVERPAERVTQPQAVQASKPAPQVQAATTNCPACGGLVAYGAKNCPHCGKSKPAPNPPTRYSAKHFLLAVVIVVVLVVIGNSNPTPKLTVSEVVNICAKEIGIEPGSNRVMSMRDIKLIDDCINRYGFKTKP